MNENIDLTKILKDCPIGWEFYSSIYGNVTFRGIENDSEHPVKFFYINKDNSKKYGSVTEQGLDAPYYNGECTLFPSKDQRDWSKFTAPWYKQEKLVELKESDDEKIRRWIIDDIRYNMNNEPLNNTLNPFDRIIVRNEYDEWKCTLFSHINPEPITRFICATCESFYIYCIPYNDETKHLVGTKDEAPDFYRYWED